MKNKSYYLNYLTGLIFFFVLSTIFLSFGARSSYAGTSPGRTTILYLCNLNSGTRWEIEYSYFDSTGDPLRDTLYVYTNNSGSPTACTSGAVNYAGDTINNYVPDSGDTVKWNSSCVDPTVPAVVTARPEGTLVMAVGVDVTCKQGTGLARYAKCDLGSPNNLGNVSYFSACPIAPACVSNCSGVGTHQCSGNTSQTCQTVSGSPGCTRWTNTTVCTSDCDNNTGLCRYRTCSGSACVWTGGNSSDGCTSSPTCAPAPPTNCDFNTPERRMISSCSYQVCQSPSPGSWGPTLSCPPNTILTAVPNAFKYSCQSSPGSCTGPTPTTPPSGNSFSCSGSACVNVGAGNGNFPDSSCNGTCVPSGGFCGDGGCNGGNGESCSTCPSDCGVCPALNTITITVYNDANGNGSRDSGENGINGVRIDTCSGINSSCTSSSSNYNGAWTTNTNGQYAWQAIGSASETFSIVPPPGYSLTTTNPLATSVPPDKSISFGLSGSPEGNVFITSTQYSVNLGGLAGADAKCQTRASAAGLGGTWKAWLSDRTTSAASRLVHSTSPYYRMDGVKVADNWADLTDDSLDALINRTEFNTAPPTNSLVDGSAISSVITNSFGNGTGTQTITNNNACLDWTSTGTGGTYSGGKANSATAGNAWTYYFNAGCDQNVGNHSLYCFQQTGPAPTSTPTPSAAPSLYSISGNVYVDGNGNGSKDSGETNYSGAAIRMTAPGLADTRTTDGSGNYLFNFLAADTYTVTLTPPSGYVATTANPRTATLPPSQIVNFGIRPPTAPSCTIGYSPSGAVSSSGQTKTLTLTCSGVTGTPTYNWNAETGTVPGSSSSNSVTWTATSATMGITSETVAGQVCDSATSLCSPSAATEIPVNPSFTIAGSVFVDQNKDGIQNGSDANYPGGITITSSGGSITYPSNGTYLVSNLPAGNYQISYTGLPTGYQITYPLNGPPPSFSVRVGPGCSVGGSNSASCTSNNIINLRFGITNSVPWIQSTGGDITGDNVSDTSGGGFTSTIPAGASCGPYASITGSGGTPGIIYSGAGSYNFGLGQASQSPYNWVVGGSGVTSAAYTPLTPGIIKTSYNYVSSVAQQSNITPTPLGSSQCGAGGIANCQLSSTLANGVYIANGNLTLTGANYTFPGSRNIVILVNGDLTIRTKILVPIGSTVFFTASRDILIDRAVGEAVVSSTASDVEGYYSADRNFVVQGNNSCPTTDLRLNVAGAVVVNAGLSGGTFQNLRDLCAGNLQCPAFSIRERADFILNSPEFMKTSRRVWREVAP